MLHNLCDRVNHIIGARLLPRLAIDLCPVADILGIWNHARTRDAGSNGRELVKGLCVAELAAGYRGGQLVVAGGDVVGDCVAEDVGGSVGSGDVFAVAADDDGEFAFVVELGLAVWVDGDGFEGAGERVAGLHEYRWVLGDLKLLRLAYWLVI